MQRDAMSSETEDTGNITDKEKWVTIAEVGTSNSTTTPVVVDSSSSASYTDGFSNLLSFVFCSTLATHFSSNTTTSPSPNNNNNNKKNNDVANDKEETADTDNISVESIIDDNFNLSEEENSRSSTENPSSSTHAAERKHPKRLLPSYYADSFHEHFFPHEDNPKKLSIPQRYAMSMARKPKAHLSIAFVVAAIVSFLGLILGNFRFTIDNAGWWSRGTLIANRATQETIVSQNKDDLFFDTTGEVWKELQNTIQPNWQSGDIPGVVGEASEEIGNSTLVSVCSGEWYGSMDMVGKKEKNLNAIWKTKDAESKQGIASLLDADSLYDQCLAEEYKLTELENINSCYKCGNEGDGKCVDPYSLVLMARLHLMANDITQFPTISPSDTISCDALQSSWTADVQQQFTEQLKSCVYLSILMSSDDANKLETNGNLSCAFPFRFLPTIVDESFPTSDPPLVRYSSSYYATKKSQDIVYEMFTANENSAYDKADGVYDTTGVASGDFYDYYSDSIVGKDMALAAGSAVVTTIAMMIHTKSPWLTLIGLIQILFSFPLAYFVYHFIGQLTFFPFLNFIGIFVVFALGADDVFVAVDKWKNARRELPYGTTEQVAALALPDAAYAMLLTTTTTAVAFFGTAICPVGPIVCFAVFCGLLITFDYFMDILLVFPALCLYDKWLLAGSKNCLVKFEWCDCKRLDANSDSSTQKSSSTTQMSSDGNIDMEEQIIGTFATEQADIGESVVTFACGTEMDQISKSSAKRKELLEEEHQTLIHRILDSYYNFLHKFRWLVLAVVITGIITCALFAAQLSLPTSSDVSLLPDGNEYQKHAKWTQSLLSTKMVKDAGTEATILWGVTPADTGHHLTPDLWTTLELDDSFDPKSEESQTYLLGFCDRLFSKFGKVNEDYQCPINLFDKWLEEESASNTPSEAYTASCSGESSVPVSSNSFHECIISWSKLTNNTSVLSTDGSVKIIEVRAKSDVAYDAPFDDLKDEWNSYETWLDNERSSTAPSGVNQVFHSDIAFWWYDTNRQMMQTAYGSAAIALTCASLVFFISSRSFVLTLFAAVSISYVLVAATACLVGLGWELGFLESILFAILIGISSDFVIHVGHAYTMYPGAISKHYRAHFALTHMCPSILAAAFTTFAAASVMIFTEITFFRKFAIILFMTIVHSVIGCFIVFLVLCDCFGPSEPQKGYTLIKKKLSSLRYNARDKV